MITRDLMKGCGTVVPIGGGHWERRGGGGDYRGSSEGVWHCRPYRRWPLGEEGGGGGEY